MRDFVSFDADFDDEAIILASSPLLPVGHPAIVRDFGDWSTNPRIASEILYALGVHINERWEKAELERYLQKRGGNDLHRAYSFTEKLERAIQNSHWIVKVDTRYHFKAIWRSIRELEAEYAYLETGTGPLTPEEDLLYIRNQKTISLLHWSIKFGLPATISPVGIWLPGDIREMTQTYMPGFLDAFYYNDAVGDGRFQGELNLINGPSMIYAQERYAANLFAGGYLLNGLIYGVILISAAGGLGNMAGGVRAKGRTKAAARTAETARTVGRGGGLCSAAQNAPSSALKRRDGS